MDSCYICLQDSSQEPYVEPNPCSCKGSIKIHQSCFIQLYEDRKKCLICNKSIEHKLNGYFKIYYITTGKLKKEGLFKNGIEKGVWNYYTEDGKLNEQVLFINGRDAIMKSYYPSGALKIHHIWKDYNYDTADHTLYYENGSIKQKGTLILNKMHGYWTSYYKNGSLCEEGIFYYGNKNGLFKNYYTNGSIKIEKYYQYDIPNETWNYYDIHGKKIAEELFYSNGVIQRRKDFNLRTWIFYDENGEKITEIVY